MLPFVLLVLLAHFLQWIGATTEIYLDRLTAFLRAHVGPYRFLANQIVRLERREQNFNFNSWKFLQREQRYWRKKKQVKN